jgi:O-Antigen ligase
MVTWRRLTGLLLAGYLTFGRSFAYLGIPPLFIGEIALGAFLVLKPRVALGTWVASLLRPSPLNSLGLALLAFVAYGSWQVGRGVLGGYPAVSTLKYFTFNYYTLFLFMGIWVGLQAPDLLPKLVRVIAWVNGVYGLLYIVALRNVEIYLPGFGAQDVPLFSPPAGQVVIILGLLCFERDLRAVWFVLLLNVVVTLAWQVRSEWAGLALAILTWGLLTGRLGRVAAMGMAGLAVLGMLALADIRMPGRNGEVSLSESLARVVAPINLELAKELSPKAKRHAGTADWRELWWAGIWRSVHSSPMLEAVGHGYGFPLVSLAPAGGEYKESTRTPHSVFYYALGLTGWVGVVLFGALQFAILRLLWRSYRLTGQAAGLAWWVLWMVRFSFEEGLETPMKAIPFYLMIGICMAPALQWQGERIVRTATARRWPVRVVGTKPSPRPTG